MRFLTNPKTRKKRKRRKLYGAAAAAHAKKSGRRKARRRTKASTKRRRNVSKGHSMAKRRRRRHRRAGTAVARRRRRSYSRNPRRSSGRRRRSGGFRSAKGLLGMAVQGAKDAAAVVLGKAASRVIPATIGLNLAGPMGIATQAAAGLVAGYAASRFLGQRVASFVIAGAFAAPMESLVRSFNIPIVSGALGDYAYTAVDPNSQDALGAYAPDLGAYALSGAEDFDDLMYTA